jgi:hypothetical protein
VSINHIPSRDAQTCDERLHTARSASFLAAVVADLEVMV